MELSETTIVDYTLYTLGFFSMLSWVVIIFKAGSLLWQRWQNRQFFWTYNQDIDALPSQLHSTTSQIGRLYHAATDAMKHLPEQALTRMEYYQSWHELLERTLKQQIMKEKAKLDTGLGWLATFGSISPFVGLFGTVWGIMHALQDISKKGSASLEVVAGPIGEALIATALGIAVAIPAVIGYNFFLRQHRTLIHHLENFANDYLHNIIQKHLLHQVVKTNGYSDTK